MSLFNILIDIAANTASFESGLKRVESQLSEFGENVKKAFEFAGIGLGLRELIGQFDEFAEHAEAVGHAAEKTGLAVDELSRLQYAAARSGVATDELTVGIERFSKTLTQAVSAAGEQRAAFDAMRISITNSAGELRPMNELLRAVADKFASYQDGAEKAALAQILFGRSGADLIPLLNEGAKGLEDLGRRADELGVTLDDKTVKGAKAFNDKLTDLHAVSQAFWRTLDSQLLPTMTAITGSFIGAGQGANKFAGEIQPLVTGIKLLTDVGYTVYHTFLDVGRAIGALGAIATSPIKQAGAIWKEYMDDTQKSLAEADSFLTKLWSDAGNSLNNLADTAEKDKDKIKAPIVELVKASDMVSETLGEIEKKMNALVNSDANRLANIGSQMSEALNRTKTENVHFWDQLDSIGQQGARQIQQNFEDFFFDPVHKGFGGLIQDFATTIRRMIAQAEAADLMRVLFGIDSQGNSGLGNSFTQGLLKLFGAGSGSGGTDLSGSGFGGQYGGLMASGGPLESGKWYIAGEHGPEPIWGGGAGAYAAGYGGGAGPTINIITNMDNRGASVELIKALPTILRKHGDSVKADIITGLQRGKYAI